MSLWIKLNAYAPNTGYYTISNAWLTISCKWACVRVRACVGNAHCGHLAAIDTLYFSIYSSQRCLAHWKHRTPNTGQCRGNWKLNSNQSRSINWFEHICELDAVHVMVSAGMQWSTSQLDSPFRSPTSLESKCSQSMMAITSRSHGNIVYAKYTASL